MEPRTEGQVPPGRRSDRADATEPVGLVTFVSDGMTPTAAKLALVVFGSDLVFAAIRAWQLFSREAAGKWFRLDVDGSLPEIAQYIKFLVIAGFMVHLARRTRLRWYLVWALSFAFLMLDDALMIHERVSERLSPSLAGVLPTGADPQAVGELGYFAVVGGVIALVAIVGIVSSPGPFRRMSIDVIMLLALGALFAVGVDVFHGLLTLDYVGNSLFAVVEDGGEMAAVSLIVIYSAMVDGHAGRLTHWLANVRSLRS